MSMGVPVPDQPDGQLSSDGQPFTGAHPTNRELVEQLRAWGFTQRKQDGVHAVFRGPKGGTVRVIRSQLGRADTAVADKAARLAGVTPAQFWAGPPQPGYQAPAAGGAATPRRRTGGTRDRITSLVLALHAAVDRPLGFDQVVELSGNRVTRAQVRTASAALCREGDLDRIRSGVYQWAAGQRAAARHIPPARRAREALPRQAPVPQEQARAAARPPGRLSAAELFGQLFPAGVQMTAELLADLEQWTRLTSKLAAQDGTALQDG
jgi:hypothetical protein